MKCLSSYPSIIVLALLFGTHVSVSAQVFVPQNTPEVYAVQSVNPVDESTLHRMRAELQQRNNLDADDLTSFLEKSKAFYGEDDGRYWTDLLWVASYCYDYGDVAQAATLMKTAKKGSISSSAHFYGEDKSIFLMMYYDLYARIELKYGSVPKGISALKKSCQLKKGHYGETSLEHVDALVQIANAYANYSKPDKAIEYHNSALTALSENVKTAFREKDELQREQYWALVSPYFEGTLDAVFFTRAIEGRQKAISRAAYDAILLSKAALMSASSMKGDYDYVTTSEIAERMGNEDVCVEFFHTRTGNYGALVLKKEWQTPRCVRLDRNFSFLGQKLTFDDAIPYTPPYEDNPDYLEFLRSLGRTVWPRELTRWFPTKGAGRVFFATAGKLDLCPIECLPLSSDGRQLYAEQAFDLYRMSSTRELAVRKTGNLLQHVGLIGGIDYQLNSAQVEQSIRALEKEGGGQSEYIRLKDSAFERSLASGKAISEIVFPPLPGSLSEVNHIDSLLSHQADILTGSYAVQKGITTLLARSSTIVVSTHGFGLEDIAEKLGNDVNTLVNKDPLLSCGVLLAGDDSNSGPLSRFYYARQIVEQDLSHVRLAILASCNSLGGTLQKDGVYGLMRAFKLSGTLSVIVSMWPIDDNVSNLFMKTLFKFLTEGGNDVYSSFRMSRETIRQQYPNVYQWSPFVLIDGLQSDN